jgi:hypothetical protein
MRIRQGRIVLTAEHTQVNSTTAALTAATNGVAVPDGYRHEYCHFVTAGENSSHWNVYGKDEVLGDWFFLDEVTHTSGGHESTKLTGASGWDRVGAVRVDTNATNGGINASWGFSEG